jgi:hypothetical protein
MQRHETAEAELHSGCTTATGCTPDKARMHTLCYGQQATCSACAECSARRHAHTALQSTAACMAIARAPCCLECTPLPAAAAGAAGEGPQMLSNDGSLCRHTPAHVVLQWQHCAEQAQLPSHPLLPAYSLSRAPPQPATTLLQWWQPYPPPAVTNSLRWIIRHNQQLQRGLQLLNSAQHSCICGRSAAVAADA